MRDQTTAAIALATTSAELRTMCEGGAAATSQTTSTSSHIKVCSDGGSVVKNRSQTIWDNLSVQNVLGRSTFITAPLFQVFRKKKDNSQQV